MTFGLASYRTGAGTSAALSIEGKLYDLVSLVKQLSTESQWPASISSLITEWKICGPLLKNNEQELIRIARSGAIPPISDQSLSSPYVPERIFCAAANYAAHKKEMGESDKTDKTNSNPYFFTKFANSIAGPNDVVRKPSETSRLDWEVELAVVIGKTGRRVSQAEALDLVAGYTILNDVSARDLSRREDYPFKFDWFQGKCHDTFAPMGPWIVPVWHVPDPQNLKLGLNVNEQVMQNDNTSEMIWNVREQISYLSTIVTLQPGDIIATGTPTGVGAGRGIFLNDGDVMTAWIEGIGTLSNQVADEVSV